MPLDIPLIDIHTHIGRLPGVVGEVFTADDLCYIAEREGARVLLLVDQSLSMFFGSRTCCKSVTAAHIAALLAWAALQGNDRVGGLVYNDTDHAEVRPKRQASNVLRLLNMCT